jgi:hypothetical protein
MHGRPRLPAPYSIPCCEPPIVRASSGLHAGLRACLPQKKFQFINA